MTKKLSFQNLEEMEKFLKSSEIEKVNLSSVMDKLAFLEFIKVAKIKGLSLENLFRMIYKLALIICQIDQDDNSKIILEDPKGRREVDFFTIELKSISDREVKVEKEGKIIYVDF